jgi:hypothetical protein
MLENQKNLKEKDLLIDSLNVSVVSKSTEADDLTKRLDEMKVEIEKLNISTVEKPRNQVNVSDKEEADVTVFDDEDMVQDEPPDKLTVDDEDLNSGFHLGR